MLASITGATGRKRRRKPSAPAKFPGELEPPPVARVLLRKSLLQRAKLAHDSANVREVSRLRSSMLGVPPEADDDNVKDDEGQEEPSEDGDAGDSDYEAGADDSEDADGASISEASDEDFKSKGRRSSRASQRSAAKKQKRKARGP